MSKKYIYLIATILSVLFFYFGVPLDFLHEHNIAVTLIGAVVSTVLLAYTIFNFYGPTAEKKVGQKDDLGCFLMVLIVIFFFGFSFLLIYSEIKKTGSELSKNGIYTNGVIVDGELLQTRKADLSNVTIKFKTKEGQEMTVVEDISAGEFEKYSKFQEVPIIYSKNYPTITRIIKSDSELSKYTKTEIRDLTLKDFMTIIDLPNPIEVNGYLNSVNRKWNYENDSETNTTIYYNNYKNIALRVMPYKSVVYKNNEVNRDLFSKELKRLGFEEITKEGVKGRLLTNGKYAVNFSFERVETDDPNDSVLNFSQITVVNFVKLN
jgi:hypothetical protein